MSSIEPRRFVGIPLITMASAAIDYSVFAEGISAGRIILQRRSFG